MKIVRGKYLCFLDADDVFDVSMLKKAFRCAEKNTAEIVIWGGCTFSDVLTQKRKSKGILNFSQLPFKGFLFTKCFTPEAISNRFFQIGWGVPWNKLFLRSFVEENKLSFSETRTSNDIYFVFAAMVAAKKIAFLKKYLVFYRRSGKGKSLQESFEKSPTDFIATQTQLDRFLKEKTKGEFELSFLKMLVCNSFWYLKRADIDSRNQIKTELLKHAPTLVLGLPETIRSRFSKSERETYEKIQELIRRGREIKGRLE